MHMTMDQIRNLAGCYLNDDILNDIQLQRKRHMSTCDICYKRFCTEYLILMKLAEKAVIPTNMSEMERSDIKNHVLLQIQAIGDKLKVACKRKMVNGLNWEFIYMPQVAAARGNQGVDLRERYVNKESEYSYIGLEKGNIVIQLDRDVFPVEQLKVCVTTGLKCDFYDFCYDDTLECYIVTLDCAALSENFLIEIIEALNE